MLSTDPLDALVLDHARARDLRAQAAVERLRPISTTRRAAAGLLRRAANRLDRAPIARRPASQL